VEKVRQLPARPLVSLHLYVANARCCAARALRHNQSDIAPHFGTDRHSKAVAVAVAAWAPANRMGCGTAAPGRCARSHN
jgi:hypothetical protein